MSAVALEVRDLTVRFGARAVVDRISFSAAGGEIYGLLGPSGCGKSTTLKALAGLIQPNAGELSFGGRVMNAVAPHRRRVGMVFQSYALFPHLTVIENLCFGLRRRGIARGERERRVARILQLVRIAELAHAYPDRLSGGQQ